jgi:hypothetical protein
MATNRIRSVRSAPRRPTAKKDSPAYPLRRSHYSAGSVHPATAMRRAPFRVESEQSLRSGEVLLDVFAGVVRARNVPVAPPRYEGMVEASVDELADSVTKVVERRLSGRLPWGR